MTYYSKNNFDTSKTDEIFSGQLFAILAMYLAGVSSRLVYNNSLMLPEVPIMSIYVGNLPKGFVATELVGMFQKYGLVTDFTFGILDNTCYG